MKRISVLLALGYAWQASTQAQVLEYIDCDVSDPASFIAAASHFYESMAGGVRPTVSIDANLWNGSSSVTHTVIVAYESHRALEAFFDRIEANPMSMMQMIGSINQVATCDNEGLAVELAHWGDLEEPWEFYAVYPLTTSDPAAYGAALGRYAASVIDEAPGPIAFYQNRAGQEDVSHFVVFFSPSLAGLNEFLDGLTTSDAYADFVDDVADIRTLGTATQAQRIMTWAP